MAVIAKCAGCGANNKIPAGTNVRCGKCKRVFTPLELQAATLGDRVGVPTHPAPAGDDTDDEDEQYYACKDDENCGWTGTEDELVEGDRCPECGKKTIKD